MMAIAIMKTSIAAKRGSINWDDLNWERTYDAMKAYRQSKIACGLFGLALLPSAPSDLDIIWRMALCGAGFGLFQSPNNHTIVSSAPAHRSGGASGMLGTARLLGQSTGAALVALLFNLLGNSGTHTALLLAGTFAVVAAAVSGLRVTQPRVRL